MIVKYKEQQSTERGFGFLKDPLFFAGSVFLKSPERIETLALTMGLCLLVYTKSVDTSELPDAADLLNQLKAQRKKSKASIADVEAVLELLSKLKA